ncbi:MAG TPA: NAD(P)-dependent oxidoreductase [Mycobacteriales bacterium]|nr:NAD(P)-dependent oxidoreductase [Mycobacteriales bacterium]
MAEFGAHPQARPGAGRKVLVTGAAGRIGVITCAGLAARGWKVRGLDRVPLDGVDGLADPPVVADVRDAAAVRAAAAGVEAVVHLAGIATESTFAEILESNIEGTFNVFDAARQEGVGRIVYASSNHAVGYTPRSALATVDVPPRPDTYYGVSKVFGEALGSLLVDRYGLEVVCLRIGSWKQYPESVRELSTWISPADGVRLIAAALTAPDVTFSVVYGISANTRAWWDLAPARALGYLSVDDAEDYADRIPGAEDDPDRSDPEWARVGGGFAGPAFDEPRLGQGG